MPADPQGGAPRGIIVAAPASGSGKTLVTLALLRRLARDGVAVAGAKAGPDYIDPTFHAAACGRPCRNLDVWAMRPATLAATVDALGDNADLIIAEGVMGLFDGIALPGRPDTGSTADLAALTGWPVVLVVDAGRQAASAGALLRGFATHRADVPVAGVIFNRVGSQNHRDALAAAAKLAVPDMAILGFVPRDAALALPERHLGLVPAGERAGLDGFLDRAATIVGDALDLDALAVLARPTTLAHPQPVIARSNATKQSRSDADAGSGLLRFARNDGDRKQASSIPLPPLGQRIAVARDDAFVFAYDAVLDGWRAAGAEIVPFAPLADKAPDASADAVYLPGGWPELHAGALAAATRFRDGLRAAAARGATVYGECGGYMALGEALTDADGTAHRMAGLLPLETSFAARRLQLGYREVVLPAAHPLGAAGTRFRGHEFHYATVTREGAGQALFRAASARGEDLGAAGLVAGTVAGSFVHLIDAHPNDLAA
jgi:cobyrinic acid a,c-diamide synthase